MAFIFKLLGLGKALVRWIITSPTRLAFVLLAIVAIGGWARVMIVDADRDKWERQATVERVAHAATVENYRVAELKARALALADKEAVEAQWRAQYQEAIDAKDNLQRDYRSNLADWLRRSDTRSDNGATCNADMSGPAIATGGVDNNASTAIVPVADLQRCADLAAHLAALIQWVTDASSVQTEGAGVAL